MSSRNKRRGFTLVELLVVISIIGMLAALLLPAVQNAREAARRATCVNNQRQLGLAVINYEGTNNAFPGYRDVQAILAEGTKQAKARPVGWIFQLTPYMDRNDIFGTYGKSAPDGSLIQNQPAKLIPPNLGLKIAECPSDAQIGSKSNWENYVGDSAAVTSQPVKGFNSYVCNAGMSDLPQQQAESSSTVRDPQANGVFFDRFPYADNLGSSQNVNRLSGGVVAATGLNPSIKLATMTTSYLTAGDGATTTLMISENADCGNWYESGETMVGFNWYPAADQSSGKAVPISQAASINGLVGQRVNAGTLGASDAHFARPSSFHPGGVVAVFCDGHTNFLNDSIDYGVYGQLMSSRGKFTVAPNGNPVPPVYKLPLDEGSY